MKLGDINDDKIMEMSKGITEGNYFQNDEKLRQINEHIGSRRLLAGGFYSGIYHIYSKKYLPIEESNSLNMSMYYSEFRYKK